MLSRLFRRLFLEKLTAAHNPDSFNSSAITPSSPSPAFATYLAPLRKTEWVVYTKRPFGGPEAVLAYLSRYTHRVAIANSRLIAFDQDGVTFRWKDYRVEGRDRYKLMTLATDEFIRRFLIHVLPPASTASATTACWPRPPASTTSRARQLLAVPTRQRYQCHRAGDPLASLSVLRWPHYHHRDLRARPTPRYRPAPNIDQDRYVMTTPEPQPRTFVRVLSWFSTRSNGDRSNIQPSAQIPQQLSSLT